MTTNKTIILSNEDFSLKSHFLTSDEAYQAIKINIMSQLKEEPKKNQVDEITTTLLQFGRELTRKLLQDFCSSLSLGDIGPSLETIHGL